MDYHRQIIEIRKTGVFESWLSGLRDHQARARINIRIDRLSIGNRGDAKALGGGISELRIDYGPGYRIYFAQRGAMLIVLLAGGDKRNDRFIAPWRSNLTAPRLHSPCRLAAWRQVTFSTDFASIRSDLSSPRCSRPAATGRFLSGTAR